MPYDTTSAFQGCFLSFFQIRKSVTVITFILFTLYALNQQYLSRFVSAWSGGRALCYP